MRNPLLETNEFYPYGLKMANISYKASMTMVNRYGWNGGSEFEDEGELNYYETPYRKYDPQIGRFTGIDMLAEQFGGINPYQFGFCNPVMFNDPTGALTTAEFNNIISSLWNSPFGGTWSSDGGGGGGGYGGGSNIYFFGNDQTASFFGGLAASGINYGFGTDGNLRVNGMFVTSVTNKTRNGNAGVSFGGYYENRGSSGNGNSLAEVTMGSQFFKYQQSNISASSGEDGTFSSWYSNRYGQFDSQVEAYRSWQGYSGYHEGEGFWDRTFRTIAYGSMEARRDYAGGGYNMFGGYGGISKSLNAAVVVGDGGEYVSAMNVVREINKGEKIAEIVSAAQSRTFATGVEHAVVTLGPNSISPGTRVLVSGGQNGISFGAGQISRIFGHTHPYATGISAADRSALGILGQSKQYVFEGFNNFPLIVRP
jgi:RHS repeat-associated protein